MFQCSENSERAEDLPLTTTPNSLAVTKLPHQVPGSGAVALQLQESSVFSTVTLTDPELMPINPKAVHSTSASLHPYTVSHKPKNIPCLHVRANGTRKIPQALPLLMLRFSYFYLKIFSYFSLIKQIEHTYTREILNPMDTSILLSHDSEKWNRHI